MHGEAVVSEREQTYHTCCSGPPPRACRRSSVQRPRNTCSCWIWRHGAAASGCQCTRKQAYVHRQHASARRTLAGGARARHRRPERARRAQRGHFSRALLAKAHPLTAASISAAGWRRGHASCGTRLDVRRARALWFLGQRRRRRGCFGGHCALLALEDCAAPGMRAHTPARAGAPVSLGRVSPAGGSSASACSARQHTRRSARETGVRACMHEKCHSLSSLAIS